MAARHLLEGYIPEKDLGRGSAPANLGARWVAVAEMYLDYLLLIFSTVSPGWSGIASAGEKQGRQFLRRH